MTVSELFKKFRCCKPTPILPTTQIQTTSYTYQLAFVQWALEYVLNVTESYEDRVQKIEDDQEALSDAFDAMRRDVDGALANLLNSVVLKSQIEFNSDNPPQTEEDLENIVFDGKTYKIPEGGGGSSKPEIMKAYGMITSFTSGGAGSIPLFKGPSTTDKLSVNGQGQIVIGSGVSLIKISGGLLFGLYDGGGSTGGIMIYKSGTTTGAQGFSYINSTASGVMEIPISSDLLEVSEGDTFECTYSGMSGVTLQANLGTARPHILIEVIG